MALIWLVLLGNVDHTVTLTQVEQTGFATQRPIAIAADGTIAVFTSDYELHLLDDGKGTTIATTGQGPGEFDRSFRALAFRSDGIEVSHRNGHRIELFSREGALIDSVKQEDPYRRVDLEDNHISVRPAMQNPMGVEVLWQHGEEQQTLDLGIAKEDLVSQVGTYTQTGDNTCLVYTNQSRQRVVYYTLIDLKSGQIKASGRENLIDPRVSGAELAVKRIPNATVPVLEGCSYSPEIGYVMTENTVPRDYRILRILNPDTGQFHTIKVVMPQFDVIFFQHLEGNRWMGYNEAGDWIRFELEPSILIAG